LIIVVISLIVTTTLLFCEDLSKFINKKRKIISELIIKNEGFFTILFTFIFLFEQLLLIAILALFFDVSKWLSAIVGIFALFVVTTAAFQKFIWQYKFKWSEDMRKSAEDVESIVEEQKGFIQFLLGKLRKKD